MVSRSSSVDSGPAPFVIRLVEGDITRVQASMLVVNHFNGLAPAGAEGAVDSAMRGAISRRAANGAMHGRFGSTEFLPTQGFALAAPIVLVLGLGDPEAFSVDRLPELGEAIVESAATLGLRDAATVLHGAGSAGIDSQDAARLLVSGVVVGLKAVQDAGCFRELAIVEFQKESLSAIEKGILSAAGMPGLHIYLQRDKVEGGPPGAPATFTTSDMVPQHLRIGITRAGPQVKVTAIGHDAFDRSASGDFPADEAQNISNDLGKILVERNDEERRIEALRSIGVRLYNNFFAHTGFNLEEMVQKTSGDFLVLRLDETTVDLPWEILQLDGQYLSRKWQMARQLESGVPGRQSAFVPADKELRVLVIGDPTQDLPGAKREAEDISEKLRSRPGASVTCLIQDAPYAEVSRELDSVNYDVLHYAGHARFDSLRQGASGLVLSDHILTAKDLSTRRFLPRLFFANACNSARTGDGKVFDPFQGTRPTINMVSGLLSAGAGAFVGSMWDVDDNAALTFARAFYDGLLPGDGRQARMAVGEAVRTAREAVITEHGEGQPAWAGYSLYGSPWKQPL